MSLICPDTVMDARFSRISWCLQRVEPFSESDSERLSGKYKRSEGESCDEEHRLLILT